jgi:hypothetical protein
VLAIQGIDDRDRAFFLNNLGEIYLLLENEDVHRDAYGDVITQFRLASEQMPRLVREKLKDRFRSYVTFGTNLLMHAVDTESKEMVEFLVANGVRIDGSNIDLDTVLVRAKSVEMAKFLLDKGADIHAIGSGCRTPLEFFIDKYVAGNKHSLDMVAILLARGAYIEAKNFSGTTALVNAAGCENKRQDEDWLKNHKMCILLERGADVNAVDNKGKTALMHAVERLQDNEDYLEQLKARVTLLIDSGANIGMKDNDGRTVFDLCKSEELKKFIKDAHKQYSSGGIDLK